LVPSKFYFSSKFDFYNTKKIEISKKICMNSVLYNKFDSIACKNKNFPLKKLQNLRKLLSFAIRTVMAK